MYQGQLCYQRAGQNGKDFFYPVTAAELDSNAWVKMDEEVHAAYKKCRT